MVAEPNAREAVHQDIEAIKEHAKSYTVNDFRSGEWFVRFLLCRG
jgi:hypothetical protein